MVEEPKAQPVAAATTTHTLIGSSVSSGKDNGDETRRLLMVKMAACLQILAHHVVERKLWLRILKISTTTASFSSPSPSSLTTSGPPKSSAFELPISSDAAEIIELLAGWIYLLSLLWVLARCFADRRHDDKIDGRAVMAHYNNNDTFMNWAKWAVAFCFVLRGACFNVIHLQPQVIHGVALLLAPDVAMAKIVLAGTWLWSGIHKINPRFLTVPNRLIDPVWTMILGPDLQRRRKRFLRLLPAISEAMAGLCLLIGVFFFSGSKKTKKNDNHDTSNTSATSTMTARLLRLASRASVNFLAFMHVIIIVNLLRLNWNHHVIGWNVSCLFLVTELWRDSNEKPKELKQTQEEKQKQQQKRPIQQEKQKQQQTNTVVVVAQVVKADPIISDGGGCDDCTLYGRMANNKRSLHVVLYAGWFVFLPVLVCLGCLDPYLGNSLYSDNLPCLDMELPVSGIEQGLYQQWGVFDNSTVFPAMTVDGRSIISLTQQTYQLRATGSLPYSSGWSQKALASSICQALLDADVPTDDVRFLRVDPYTGFKLVWSLYAMVFPDQIVARKNFPSIWMKQNCRRSSSNSDEEEWYQLDPTQLHEEDNEYDYSHDYGYDLDKDFEEYDNDLDYESILNVKTVQVQVIFSMNLEPPSSSAAPSSGVELYWVDIGASPKLSFVGNITNDRPWYARAG